MHEPCTKEMARLQIERDEAKRYEKALRRSLFLTLKAIEGALDRHQAIFTPTEFAALEQAKRVLGGEIDS